MGGQGAVLPVIAGDRHPDLNAGPLLRTLADDAHRLGGNILGNDIGAGAGKPILGHGIAHRSHVAHILFGISLAVILLGQLCHALLRCGVLRQAQSLLQGLNGAFAVLFILVGPILRQDNGQPVPPGLPPLLQQVDDLDDGGVAPVIVHVQGIVNDVVAGAVACQHSAVPVQDLPPGGLDFDSVRAAGKGKLLIFIPFHKLPLDQAKLIDHKHRQHQQDAGGGTADLSQLGHFQREGLLSRANCFSHYRVPFSCAPSACERPRLSR